MRKLTAILLALPLFGLSQTKNVVSTNRVFPKADKVLEFEKALAAHAQKYHTGDWKWRVYEIASGPDAGGYQMTEGPTTWTAMDGRGNISTDHNNDWNRNVAVYLTDRGSESYAVYVDSLSTVALGDYSDKIIINHMQPKPGMIGSVNDLIKQLKKAWQAGNETVAVYSASMSGEPEYITVLRLKAGLKELEEGYRKPLAELYNTVNGAGSWARFQDDYSKSVQKRWSEMLTYRADLSSK